MNNYISRDADFQDLEPWCPGDPDPLNQTEGKLAAALTRHRLSKNQRLVAMTLRAINHWTILSRPALQRFLGHPNDSLLHRAINALVKNKAVRKLGRGRGETGTSLYYAAAGNHVPEKYEELEFLYHPGNKIVLNRRPSSEGNAYVKVGRAEGRFYFRRHRWLVSEHTSLLYEKILQAYPKAVAHSEFVLRNHFGWQFDNPEEGGHTYVPDAVIATGQGVIRVEVELTEKSYNRYLEILPRMDRDWDTGCNDLVVYFVFQPIQALEDALRITKMEQVKVVNLSDDIDLAEVAGELSHLLKKNSPAQDDVFHAGFHALTRYVPPVRPPGWSFPVKS